MTYREGSVLTYQSHGGVRTIKVVSMWPETAFYTDKGPGFDGTLIEDETMLVWGFNTDILTVDRY